MFAQYFTVSGSRCGSPARMGNSVVERGYSPTGIYPQDSDVRAGVDAANEVNGVTKAQSAAMKAGSMLGWDAPAADPANYDDQGIPIRPGRKQDRGDAR